MEYIYKYGCLSDILIIDEYDSTLLQQPYYVYHQSIKGLWQLRDKKVIAFSATSTNAIEKFVTKVIRQPAVIRFKSEYELVSGASPIQEGKIVSCGTEKEVLKQAADTISANYDSRPIILIHDE
jgi:superfamily II DNA/RNA helicase